MITGSLVDETWSQSVASVALAFEYDVTVGM